MAPRLQQAAYWLLSCAGAAIFESLRREDIGTVQISYYDWVPLAIFVLLASLAEQRPYGYRTRWCILMLYFSFLPVLAILIGRTAVIINEYCSIDPALDRLKHEVTIHILLTRFALEIVKHHRIPVHGKQETRWESWKNSFLPLMPPPRTAKNTLAAGVILATWGILVFAFRYLLTGTEPPTSDPPFDPKPVLLAKATYLCLNVAVFGLLSLVLAPIYNVLAQ